jgi:HD-GYP domain-containing protein (c-di-GMP phosphodiesterase class II)
MSGHSGIARWSILPAASRRILGDAGSPPDTGLDRPPPCLMLGAIDDGITDRQILAINKRVLIGEIVPSELAIGVPLPYTVYDENHKLLAQKGAVLETQRQLDALLERGLYRVDELPGGAAGESPPENPLVRLDRLCRELNTLITGPAGGETDFEAAVLSIATRLGSLCDEHPDAVLAGMLHDRQMRYAVRHMVHCAVVVQLLADALGLAANERLASVCAALTMNLSILDLQNELNGALPRSVTENERRLIRAHPQRTVATLSALGVGDLLWLDLVAQHHEAYDGSGYPQGLSGAGIELGARIIAVADRYIARLRHRADRQGLLPNESLRDIFVSGGAEVDPQLAQFLVKTVGIFPPGLVVELENGEIGVVVRRTAAAHAPDVQVVVSRERLLTQAEARLTDQAPFRIKCGRSPDGLRFRFDPLRFWRE